MPLPLKDGDLVLRDRSYLTNGEIERHLQAGAHCIYRHKIGTTYLDPATRQLINLLKLLNDVPHDGEFHRRKQRPVEVVPTGPRE